MTKALQHLADHAWKILALLPLLALLAVQLGGEAALAGLAVALPLAVLAFGRKGGPADSGAMSDQVIARLEQDGAGGLSPRFFANADADPELAPWEADEEASVREEAAVTGRRELRSSKVQIPASCGVLGLRARPVTWHQKVSPLARFMMRLSA